MSEGTATVLLIDDDQAFLDVIGALLEKQGFILRTAASAIEALAEMERQRPDAVICDYLMPKGNGIELLKRMRARGYETPFILLTGKGREEVVIEAIDSGADYYIQKGGSVEALTAELRHKLNLAIKHAADEEELRLSQFSLENASLAILWLNEQGAVIKANRAVENLLGSGLGETIGRSMLDIDIGMSAERWSDNLDVCLKLGRLRYHTSFLLSTGEMLPVEVELNAMEMRGRPCLVGFIRDERERKLAEEYSGERLLILEGLQEMAIEYIDADMMLRWSNRGRGPMELPSPGKVTPGRCYEVLQQRDNPCPGCPTLKVFTSGKPEKGEVKDRRGHTFMVCSAPVCNADGHVVGVVNSSLDITELKSRDSSLEDALRAIDSSIDGIALLRPDQTYWYMNDAHAEIYGYGGPEELLGRTWRTLYDPLELERFGRDIMPRLQEEGSWRGEAVGRRKDGSPFAQELSLTMLSDGGLTCVVRDVSQRKAFERELEASQHLLNSIVDSSPNQIYIYDLKEHCNLYANREVLRALHYSPDEVREMGDRIFESILHPDDVDKLAAYQAELARQPDGVVLEVEYRMRSKDGDWHWLRSRGLVFSRDPDGSARSELGTADDVTQRKKMEAELRKSEERFRDLVEMAEEGIWAINLDQVFVYANNNVERMLGYGPGEIIGMSVDRFFDPSRKEGFERGLERRMKGVAEKYDFELIRKDGSRVPVRIAATPLLDDNGTYIGSMSVVVDTSEMKAKEDALERMNRRLNILSSITRHDILNQISVLGGYLELERKGVRPDKHEERLQKMAAALSSISRQIAFTKDYEEMGVKAPIWQGVSATVRAAAGGLDMEKVELVTDTKGLQVYADPLLVKVFYNLIDNSIKHGGGVTRVEVCAERRDGRMEIIYRDNGQGIPEDQRECLFARGCGGRSGLGLFLSKEILAITKIEVYEDGGADGARFHMVIPEDVYRYA